MHSAAAVTALAVVIEVSSQSDFATEDSLRVWNGLGRGELDAGGVGWVVDMVEEAEMLSDGRCLSQLRSFAQEHGQK